MYNYACIFLRYWNSIYEKHIVLYIYTLALKLEDFIQFLL